MATYDRERDVCEVYGDVENFTDAAAYFHRQAAMSNPEFWSRCGWRPDFRDKRVLEVGCGHGALSVEMGRDGAEVLGVDLNKWRVDFANRLVRTRCPELAARVRFSAEDVEDLPTDEPFDYVVSKDTLEHVDELEALLHAIYRLLKPGGILIAGSTPLYWSPKGDHGRTGLRVPSLHAVLPTSVVLRAASRYKGYTVRSVSDIGMNGYTPVQYRQVFDRTAFEQLEIRYNQGGIPARILGRLRVVPGLEKYVTTGFYLKFRRPQP